MGHDVVTAQDGVEALKEMDEATFDIAIVDIIMPNKEGLETIQEIRRDFPETRIFAQSGGGVGSPGGYLQIASALGADFTISKPFSSDELNIAINAVADPRS